MPPRRGRGRTTRRTVEESRTGSDDDVHQVENVTRQIGEMELRVVRWLRLVRSDGGVVRYSGVRSREKTEAGGVAAERQFTALVERSIVGKAVADPDPVSRRCSGSTWLQPESQGDWLFTVGGGRLRLIKSTTGRKVPSSACNRRPDEISTDGNSLKSWPEQIPARGGGGDGDGGGRRWPRLWERRGGRIFEWRLGFSSYDPWIQLAVSPQPLWLRYHNIGLAHRIMVKRLETSPHDPLGITDSACKNQLVVVSVQYGPFNPYIPIRSTTIGKSRVAKDPIAMHKSWRSNSDIASVTRVSMTFRFVRTNQYNQDLGLIHSTDGNHLESPNEGSSIDHQVTIYLHAQNITMFPTNETWYFASQILVSSSGGLILILTAQ
ncbi:sucrose synthase [Dorcoceras hygrometricum]|uniref:Sucrose synthase n=1 Tax=Dorcoceras hygrometricum TaxID=472368 RepID=A0A2Z7B696_9LAMI|nr:sucrose synthase [Dorcoceras hygrometricum]